MNQRILIVDDEKAILITFKKLLKSPSIGVDTAETIEDAQILLKKNIYDAVIVDLRLSHTDGEEGLELMKSIKQRHPQTNVILVTAYGSNAVMEKAYSLGATFYFEKPVSNEILKNALKSLNVG